MWEIIKILNKVVSNSHLIDIMLILTSDKENLCQFTKFTTFLYVTQKHSIKIGVIDKLSRIVLIVPKFMWKYLRNKLNRLNFPWPRQYHAI